MPSLYGERILPHLIHWAMRQQPFTPYRQRLVSAAEGRVLELGAGSGLNLPFYPQTAEKVLLLEPAAALRSFARHYGRAKNPRVRWLEGSAEAIPLADQSVDTVVTTWTLCSIPNVASALQDARRVLKPSGKLLFVEHGRAPDASVARWQDRLTPLWKRAAGGCHLNRPIDKLIAAAGFRIESVDTGYMRGPRMMTFMYEGCASPR